MTFSIVLKFKGGLSDEQKKVFDKAARRWEQIVTGTAAGSSITLTIEASGQRIDGPGRVLGQSGPKQIRLTDGLPLDGVMEFDLDDLADLAKEGTLESVILHEMGHVLGIGTLWTRKNLLVGTGTDDPQYKGPKAVHEYRQLLNNVSVSTVPVANTGGPGTREGHWRESVFDRELMTGYAESEGPMPLSRITIGALDDLGYTVNYDQADSYTLPPGQAVTGLSKDAVKRECIYCKAEFPVTIVEGQDTSSGGCCCVVI